ncbi:hypothetical protein LguiA_005028 [Lonicera macranthoides]
MGDKNNNSTDIYLPPSVVQMIDAICAKQLLLCVDTNAKKLLVSLGEQSSVDILRRISDSARPIRNLSGYLVVMAKKYCGVALNSPEKYGGSSSPQKQCSPCSCSCSSSSGFQPSADAYYSPIPKQLMFSSPSCSSDRAAPHKISEQLLALSKLEFRKAFLVLSYIGRENLENVMSVIDANKILGVKDLPMEVFESEIWNTYGQHYCAETDRSKYLDWDSGKTHLYYCQVYSDGSYNFKGPYLDTASNHLQRALGDENVLIVDFTEETTEASFYKVAEEGILVCLRRFRFFVFKEQENKDKKKSPASSSAKCCFVRMESIAPRDGRENYILSNKTVHEARSIFMHLHTVPSMAKYAARFSLILSNTKKLPIDLSSVSVERIDDICCYDENGSSVCNEDGEALIHTDGTGFISEDLAMMCPKDFYKTKNLKDENLEPLLIQCRLFNEGCAVKGTLLLNRTLPKRTIQIRPSMVKVETDKKLKNTQSLNSLEAVAISNKPRNATLSRYLIAHLCYGGVPQEFFLGLLKNALEDAPTVYSNMRAALKVSMIHGEIDDNFTTTGMILSGIPLNEPYLKHRLSKFANKERKGFKKGKLPISDSFNLMGTADPTGLLNRDEVCVILDNGQISGKVLVYRYPGLHFGDVHVLKATYVEELNEFVGNAKYAIFFSTKGPRSVVSEIADGDFDGDRYWVSRNHKLLKYFKPSEPWKRMYTTPKAVCRKPSEFTSEQLEKEYFQLFLNARKSSFCKGQAANSWLAFMDQLLVLGDGSADEKECIKEKMLKLIDVYYDALDSSKSGKKVTVPNELKAEMYPHYLEKENKYQSTSILGLIYDKIQNSEAENSSVEIWKLPCFDVQIPAACFNKWEQRYGEYRQEMTEALKFGGKSKNDSANEVIKKYKQMLYGAPEFEESERKAEDIYNDALAIYQITYDYAKSRGEPRDIEKCGFAWKVAGSALCKLHAFKQGGNSAVVCLPSVLGDVLLY